LGRIGIGMKTVKQGKKFKKKKKQRLQAAGTLHQFPTLPSTDGNGQKNGFGARTQYSRLGTTPWQGAGS